MRQANQLRRILLKSALVLSLLPAAVQGNIKAEGSENDSMGSTAEQYLLAAANQERVGRGLQPLRRDPVLARAAEFHARQMANHADISHAFTGEPELTARAVNAGVHFSLISENVAEAPESAVIHQMWMESEGHRENLLDPEINVAGIAVVERDNQLYAVEDFAAVAERLSVNQQESAVAGLLTISGIPVLDAQSGETEVNAARQTCNMSSGYAGPRRPGYYVRYTVSTLKELPPSLRNRIGSGKFHQAAVGACSSSESSPFTSYNIAVLLYQ